MTLDAGEFMRRFLLHVLPTGFHRIRHFGLLANGHRTARLDLCRRLLAAQPAAEIAAAIGADPVSKPEDAAAPAKNGAFCPCRGSLRFIRSTLTRAPPNANPMRR